MTFPTYDQNAQLSEVMNARPQAQFLAIDSHIPNLIALPPETNLTKTAAYLRGRIILQDKASCFPAYLLDPRPSDGDIIDACAAPGNKTTHLAAIVMTTNKVSDPHVGKQIVFACEKDKTRSLTLEKMVRTAGADNDSLVVCLGKQDFKRLNPQDKRFRNVGALLLDPSCSGSGIIGRDEEDAQSLPKLILPRTPAQILSESGGSNGKAKKRKRNDDLGQTSMNRASDQREAEDSPMKNEPEAPTYKSLPERLEALSSFQLSLLEHAFAFPSARKVVYSTCSIHAEENEHVVLRALLSGIAQQRGWRICHRNEQIDGMKRWPIRGDGDAIKAFARKAETEKSLRMDVKAVEDITQACLRCEKGTEDGTMGFFAVKFVRDGPGRHDGIKAELDAITAKGSRDSGEWDGFSDHDE